MPDTEPQHTRSSIEPVPAETELTHNTLVAIHGLTAPDCAIPVERRFALIRRACEVALGRPTAEQFAEFLLSPVSMEAVAKITDDAQSHIRQFGVDAMSPAGFVRLCHSAGYTLAQGAVCARAAKQVVPSAGDLALAASDCQTAAVAAENWPAAEAFAKLKNEAALALPVGEV